MLAARGIIVIRETVRRWALKFGQAFANRIRRRPPRARWHLDEVAIKTAGATKPGPGRRAPRSATPDPP